MPSTPVHFDLRSSRLRSSESLWEAARTWQQNRQSRPSWSQVKTAPSLYGEVRGPVAAQSRLLWQKQCRSQGLATPWLEMLEWAPSSIGPGVSVPSSSAACGTGSCLHVQEDTGPAARAWDVSATAQFRKSSKKATSPEYREELFYALLSSSNICPGAALGRPGRA